MDYATHHIKRITADGNKTLTYWRARRNASPLSWKIAADTQFVTMVIMYQTVGKLFDFVGWTCSVHFFAVKTLPTGSR